MDDLDAADARVGRAQLAADALVVEQRERAGDRLGGRRVTELVRDVQLEVPVVLRVRLGVDLRQECGRLDVAVLVRDRRSRVRCVQSGGRESAIRRKLSARATTGTI